MGSRSGIAAALVAALALAAPSPPAVAQERYLVFGGGSTGGLFFIVAAGMARVVEKNVPGLRVTAQVTSGAVENVRLMGTSKVDCALGSADSAFHAGWAQLLLGWVLRCGVRQLHVAMHARQHFPGSPEVREAVVAHVAAVEAALADDARCRLEEYTDEEARRRHLLVNFRRQPADAAKRILL